MMAEDAQCGEEEGRGPGAVYQVFVLMENLLEKLKVLRYEELLARHNMKPVSRHYFVFSPYLVANPEEQFFLFSVLAAWLLNAAGRSFTEPQKFDEPNATVSNILAELRSFEVKVDFPPSKLKSGSGEYVCYVLDRLAEEALKRRSFSFKRPSYLIERTEKEEQLEDDTELTLSQAEDELLEEDVMDLDVLQLRSTHSAQESRLKLHEILESTVDATEWSLEVERVLPQLKVTIGTDNKDWRINVDQMHHHRDDFNSSLPEAKSNLDKLQEYISKTLENISSREKYINNQMERLIQQYRSTQAKLQEVKKRYQQASGGVTEKTRVLAEISEELKKVKQEMEEKGSGMSDGAPVVRIKQAVMKLKQETQQMELRMGVVEHSLLQAKLKEKSNMIRDMHHVPESTVGPFR